MEPSGVGGYVVEGTGFVVVVGGVGVKDCAGGVGYMEMVGEGSTVAVEGRDVGGTQAAPAWLKSGGAV